MPVSTEMHSPTEPWSVSESAYESGTVNATEDPGPPFILAKPPAEPWVESFRYVCEVWIAFPIALLGILGNLLSFIVLCNHKHKSTTRVLLQALAVTDSLFLLCTVLIRSFRYAIHGYAGGYAYMYLYRWMYPTLFMLRLGGTWLTVLLTVDRFIAVCHPLHAQRLCTLRRTYILMALMVLSTVLLCVPRFLEWEILVNEKGKKGIDKSALMKDQSYTVGYGILLYLLTMYLVPMVLMITLNSWLLRALRHATNHALHEPALFTQSFRTNNKTKTSLSSSSSSRGSEGSLALSRPTNRSITVIIIIVVLVSIACNCTAMVAHVLWSLTVGYPHLTNLDTVRRVVANISNILVTFNSAINFVIYCLCSRNFRTVCIRVFYIDRLMSRFNERRARNAGTKRMTQSSTATSYISLLRITNSAHKLNKDCTCLNGKEFEKKLSA